MFYNDISFLSTKPYYNINTWNTVIDFIFYSIHIQYSKN